MLRKKRRGRKNVVREYVESIGIAVIAALFIRALFIQAFRIPTGSMENTLLVGDFLLVNKFIYGAQIPFTGWRLPKVREPKPGDVVIFKYPKDPSLDYIKRCVATTRCCTWTACPLITPPKHCFSMKPCPPVYAIPVFSRRTHISTGIITDRIPSRMVICS